MSHPACIGAIPRPARRTPSLNKAQRSIAVQRGFEAAERERYHARSVLAFGRRHNSGPRGKEVSQRLRKFPAGSLVLVHRTKLKKWVGTQSLISVQGENSVVQMERGRRNFRSTCVKPYTESALADKGADDKEGVHYSSFTGK